MKKTKLFLITMLLATFGLANKTSIQTNNVDVVSLNYLQLKNDKIESTMPVYSCTVTVTTGPMTGTGSGYGSSPTEACQNATANAMKNLRLTLG